MFKEFINKIFSSSDDSATKEGTVKFFNRTKGFGFLKVNDSDEEIFVHKSNLIDRIKQNDKVTFGVKTEEKGPTAVNVRVVK
jgi:CspA family cold shock protein